MFQKNERGFSFTLSPRPRNPSCGPFPFFCSGPTGVPVFLSRGPETFLPAGPFPRLLAQPAQRPLPLPDSPPGGPRLSGASSSPTEPDSSLSPTRPRTPPRSTRARTPRRQPRPYKRNPRPLEAPNRSRSRRLRKNLVAPPPLLKLLGALPRRRSASYSRRHRCSGAPPW